MSNSGSGSARYDSGRNYGLDGTESDVVRSVRKDVVRTYADELRDLGVNVLAVWSPADTVADTRYQVDDGSGTQVVFQSEIKGFIEGVRKARSDG